MNYFEILGLPQKYDLDPQNIDRQYLTMQLKYHPDKVPDQKLRAEYLSISSNLNQAYKTLKDDVERAFHLLMLLGINISNNSIDDKIPSHKLEEIWQDSEFFENLNDLSSLESFLKQKKSEKDHLLNDLLVKFNTHQLKDALDLTFLLRYLVNLINNVKAKIERATN